MKKTERERYRKIENRDVLPIKVGIDLSSSKCSQETTIDSITEEAPASAVEGVVEEADEFEEEVAEAETDADAEVESAERSPRDGAGGAAAQTEAAATKIRFDEFLNLMEVF